MFDKIWFIIDFMILKSVSKVNNRKVKSTKIIIPFKRFDSKHNICLIESWITPGFCFRKRRALNF